MSGLFSSRFSSVWEHSCGEAWRKEKRDPNHSEPSQGTQCSEWPADDRTGWCLLGSWCWPRCGMHCHHRLSQSICRYQEVEGGMHQKLQEINHTRNAQISGCAQFVWGLLVACMHNLCWLDADFHVCIISVYRIYSPLLQTLSLMFLLCAFQPEPTSNPC